MKCDPATIERLCSTPGAKVGGMGLGRPSGGHVAGAGKLGGTREETAPMKKRSNKYRAVPTIYNGVRFASKSEAARAKALDEQKAAGLIRTWLGQPKYRLGVPENVYQADFFVVTADGLIRAEDVKGVSTAKFSRDVKLWRAYGEYPLWIIKGGKVAEIITPAATAAGFPEGKQGEGQSK